MTMKSEISIITPVFNGEQYLAEVIESVLAQEEIRIEHIIVNDGSTDGSLQIAEYYERRFPSRIRVISQVNGGEASAVNRGIRESSAKYLCVVNADDPLLPGHCRRMVDSLEGNEHCVVAYPDWEMVDASGETIRTVRTIEFSRRALIADFVCIPGPGAVIRSEAIENFDLRDTRYRFIGDYVGWLKLSNFGDFVRVPYVLATWRNHESGATYSRKGAPIADELLKLADHDLSTVVVLPIPASWYASARSHSYYDASLQAIYAPNINGKKFLMISLMSKPWRSWGYQTHHRSLTRMFAVLLGPFGKSVADFRDRRLMGLRN